MGLFVGWWEGLALLGLRSVELSVGQNGSFAKLGFSVGWCGFANVPIGQDTSHPVGTIVQHETCEIPKNFFGYAESFLELRKSPLHYLGLRTTGNQQYNGMQTLNNQVLIPVKLI